MCDNKKDLVGSYYMLSFKNQKTQLLTCAKVNSSVSAMAILANLSDSAHWYLGKVSLKKRHTSPMCPNLIGNGSGNQPVKQLTILTSLNSFGDSALFISNATICHIIE